VTFSHVLGGGKQLFVLGKELITVAQKFKCGLEVKKGILAQVVLARTSCDTGDEAQAI
jgi:hypothetical protein